MDGKFERKNISIQFNTLTGSSTSIHCLLLIKKQIRNHNVLPMLLQIILPFFWGAAPSGVAPFLLLVMKSFMNEKLPEAYKYFLIRLRQQALSPQTPMRHTPDN